MRRAVALVGAALALCTPVRAQVDPEQGYWMGEARLAMAEGESDAARAALERVLAMDPGNPEARELMARLVPGGAAPLDEVGSALVSGMLGGPTITPEEALARLRTDPYDPEAPQLKKILGDHYFQEAQAAEKARKQGAAMVAFRRAIFFQPREPLMRYEMFQALMRRDRLVEALGAGEVFLELQDEGALAREMQRQLVEVHTRLGTKKMQANRWSAAIEHFRKVLQVQGGVRGFGEVEEKLAICFYTLGVRDKAGGQTRQACLNFAQLLELRPASGLARESFDRAYLDKLRSNALSPLWNQGKASKEEGRPLEAFRFFGHVLTLGTQEWMLKLANKYRDEIEAIAGESLALEEARLRRGMSPRPEAPLGSRGEVAGPDQGSDQSGSGGLRAPGAAAGDAPPGLSMGYAAPRPPIMSSTPPAFDDPEARLSVPPNPAPDEPLAPGDLRAPAQAGAPLAARPPVPDGPMILPPRPGLSELPLRDPRDPGSELDDAPLDAAELDRLLYGRSP